LPEGLVTPAVLDRPASPFAERTAGAERAAGPIGGGRATLEERLNAVLHEARRNGSTECPVCHARMTLTIAGARHDGVECGGCGSRLT
jgi:hypothetical protein